MSAPRRSTGSACRSTRCVVRSRLTRAALTYGDAQAMALAWLLDHPSPLDLPWTGFWRANYTGSPWPGVESHGPTLGRDLSDGVSPPVGGTAQNGYTPADFGGVASILRTAEPAEGNYLGATTATVHAVVSVRSAPTPGTYVFDDPCIIATENSATIALGVSSSGVALGIYTSGGGPVQTAYVALSAGYHVIQARLDGTNAEVRVDGGAWSSVAATDFAADPTNVLVVGADYTGAAQFLDALVLELGITSQALTDAQLDAAEAAAVTRYALGGGAAAGAAAATVTTSGAAIPRGAGAVSASSSAAVTGSAIPRGAGACAASSSVAATATTASMAGQGPTAFRAVQGPTPFQAARATTAMSSPTPLTASLRPPTKASTAPMLPSATA